MTRSRRLPVRIALLALGVLLVVATEDPGVEAAAERRVEVIQVEGLIRGPTERAVERTLELARERNAEVLVVQIDSPGGLETERAERLAQILLASDVPVITWVGPPGARAQHAAAILALAGHARAMAPGTSLGPIENLDMRAPDLQSEEAATLAVEILEDRGLDRSAILALFTGPQSADAAEDLGLIDTVAVQLPDLLNRLDGHQTQVTGAAHTLSTDTEGLSIRLHKPDLLGRTVGAAVLPSMAYILLLAGLLGVVFEVFHPSTGPAGLAGLLGLGLAGYGIWALDGSWVGVALIVLGVVGFCIDLRFQALGVFTALGFIGLVAGSLLLFRGPWLHVNPWILGLGIVGVVLFLLGAMTRVLRDLRAVARGELEVRDAHEALLEEVTQNDGEPEGGSDES
jgi:membrane-bound serine protease (ClpP class)